MYEKVTSNEVFEFDIHHTAYSLNTLAFWNQSYVAFYYQINLISA